MNTGYTKDIPQSERDENELLAIVEILQSDPTNEYWRARFEGAPHPVEEAYRIEQEPTPNLEIDEIERDWKQQVDELRGGA